MMLKNCQNQFVLFVYFSEIFSGGMGICKRKSKDKQKGDICRILLSLAKTGLL